MGAVMGAGDGRWQPACRAGLTRSWGLDAAVIPQGRFTVVFRWSISLQPRAAVCAIAAIWLLP